jgi:hypothetical protein
VEFRSFAATAANVEVAPDCSRWGNDDDALTGVLDGDELDPSVLLLSEVGLVAATDPRFISTYDTIGRELRRNGQIMRYTNDDDFGTPETAFLMCNFWYIDALAVIGRGRGAVAVPICWRTEMPSGYCPKTFIRKRGAVGQHLDGGLINSAMRLSVKWEDMWLRG